MKKINNFENFLNEKNDSKVLNFIANVEEDQIGNVKQIAKKLSKLNCKIKNVLPSGIIVGSTSSNSLSDLKIEGILSIEREKEVRAI